MVSVCVYMYVVSVQYWYLLIGTPLNIFILFAYLYELYLYLLPSTLLYIRYTILYVYIDRDPRREYALTEAKPFLSFFLYHAHSASAPLSVLRDPNTVDEELIKYAKLYIQRMVVKESSEDGRIVVYLPEPFKTYATDFGDNKYSIMNLILRLVLLLLVCGVYYYYC